MAWGKELDHMDNSQNILGIGPHWAPRGFFLNTANFESYFLKMIIFWRDYRSLADKIKNHLDGATIKICKAQSQE